MSKKFFEFGIRFEDLEKARKRIEEILQVDLEGWEGHARGGPYYAVKIEGGTELELYQNWNSIDGEWNEPDNEEFSLFIRIDQPVRADSIEGKLVDDSILRAKLIRNGEY